MRRLALALVCALALPVVAQGAESPVVAAAKRTAAAKSSTFRMNVTSTVPGQGKVTMTGSGAQRGTDVKMTMRARSAGVSFRMDAVLVREGGSLVMYMRSPLFESQLPRGKTWVRLDLDKQARGLGLDFSSLVTASQTYAPLERGIVSTTRLGREQVAGKPATRYRAVVDVRRAARALPAYAEQLEALERTTGIRLGRMPYDVWVGSDRRIRQVRFSTPTGAGARSATVQTITLLSFNATVSIAAPPRAQVYSP